MGTLETIAVWVVVAAMAALAARSLWRTFTGRERCGGCGGACGGKGADDSHRGRGANP